MIEVEGHSIAYDQLGDGPPLVLLHGWPTNSREWHAQIDGLADELDAFRKREGLLDGDFDRRLPSGGAATDDTVGTAHGGAGNDPEGLIARLERADPGTYLVVGHPAYDDEEMRAIRGAGRKPGAVAAARDEQRRMFLANEVGERCAELGVEPIRFTEL